MAASSRAGASARSSMRPPIRNSTMHSSRYGGGPNNRHNSLAASRIDRTTGAASPAESLASVATAAGGKRKERDFDENDSEATNINVVVRCRGRNAREVRENSAVVVQTDGVKGKLVELSMGPSALSNKTYNFDRVFSQAADQAMVFDDVVKPILDEMLAGYNCTIFAYGQTGTGKTYTMSGDMTDTLGLLPDTAGIIPRVLHSLFTKLEMDEAENCVRCSFIELYNEELRDLLSSDETAKLKIYDDSTHGNSSNARRGGHHATTIVQGMEERHITTAAEGLKWLREGSVRRQVAATKCNDLSSRSHTVFTITVYVKKPGGDGEEYISAGKLNLVDLAGSENIQRSGAENKRAAEAGLINKSLLTLGRVINALVDRSAHIPYRESKLTRLLQDSLGGRTKTCIIATISPARSNLEETISTLDYAFRAKNIKNKPQLNAAINKKTLLREFTAEIEKLRTELIATRQRHGVYLTNEAYEDMTVQSESRRILAEEQAARIETLEGNLRNKVQELFGLTASFMGLRKEHEGTRALLDETKEVLDQTELVLAATRKTLAEETHLRQAHQKTEEKLSAVGGELLATLRQTVDDVGGLHAKNKRKSDLQTLNRSTWGMAQTHVSDVTEMVEGRIEAFRQGQEEHIGGVASRMKTFVQEEMGKLNATQEFLEENLAQFTESRDGLVAQQDEAKQAMDCVLDEIQVVRDTIKQRVGESLQAIAAAAERIADDVLSELGQFHTQLHASYSALGREFKTIFEALLRDASSQRSESDRLRRQLEDASGAMVQSNASVAARIQAVLDEERKQAAAERQALLMQITSLVNSQAELQESRLAGKTALIQQTVIDSNKTFEGGVALYSEGMDRWGERDGQIVEEMVNSRDGLKTKLKDDWTTANDHSTSIQTTTKSVHAETVRVVDEQKRDLDTQMRDLDDFLTRAKTQNAAHHTQHAQSLDTLSTTVEGSFENIATHFTQTFDRVQDLGEDMASNTATMQAALEPLDETIQHPLRALRDDIQSTILREYEPTGDTPEKIHYQYPTTLPRTDARDVVLAKMGSADAAISPSKTSTTTASVATKTSTIFNDMDFSESARSPSRPPTSTSTSDGRSNNPNPLSMSLREVHPNVTTSSLVFDPSASMISLKDHHNHGENQTMPLFRRRTRSAAVAGGGTGGKKAVAGGKAMGTGAGAGVGNHTVVGLGMENLPPDAFAQSTGPRRKSPRLH